MTTKSWAPSARRCAGTLLPTMYVTRPAAPRARAAALLRVPEHGIGVGRMLEAADEHEAFALGEGLARRGRLVDVGQHHHARDPATSCCSSVSSYGDTTSVTSALRDQRQLLVALRPRRARADRAAFELRLPLVRAGSAGRPCRTPRARSARTPAPRRCASRRRNAATGRRCRNRCRRTPRKFRDRPDVRVEQHLDAALLQLRHVGLPVFEVVGDERDLAAEAGQDLEQRLHAHRAGVLVRRQHAGIDHQHAPLRPAIALDARRTKPLVRCVASVAPHFRAKVPWLITWWRLTPAVTVGARRLALEVDDGGARLVVDPAAGRAHREREIGVLVVGRRVARVEAAQLAEQRACGNGEARAGAVVGLAQVVVLGLVGIVVAAQIPRGAVAPDDAARPPAGARPGRSAWRRPGRRPDASRNTASSASSQPGVTIVSLLRNTRISPRASFGARDCRSSRKPRLLGVARGARRSTDFTQRVGHGLGRGVVDHDAPRSRRPACAPHALQAACSVSSGLP